MCCLNSSQTFYLSDRRKQANSVAIVFNSTKLYRETTKQSYSTPLTWCLHRPVASIKWLGGLSEWPTLTPTPPPPAVPQLKHSFCYMSDHYFCLQYLLFLSLIFCLCWLWRNRDLVWDIVSGKFGKRLLSGFFLPNKVISYVYEGQSICSVLVNMQHREVVQSRVSRCWVQILLHPL